MNDHHKVRNLLETPNVYAFRRSIRALEVAMQEETIRRVGTLMEMYDFRGDVQTQVKIQCME